MATAISIEYRIARIGAKAQGTALMLNSTQAGLLNENNGEAAATQYAPEVLNQFDMGLHIALTAVKDNPVVFREFQAVLFARRIFTHQPEIHRTAGNGMP